MNESGAQLYHDLRDIVGEDYVNDSLIERINYADTALPYDLEKGDLPDIVVHPANSQEISEVLKYANKGKIP